MVAHRLPSFLCAATIVRSSATEKVSRRSEGLSWFFQRRRQLLLERFGMPCAMNAQLRAPCASTRRHKRASSCAVARRSFAGRRRRR